MSFLDTLKKQGFPEKSTPKSWGDGEVGFPFFVTGEEQAVFEGDLLGDINSIRDRDRSFEVLGNRRALLFDVLGPLKNRISDAEINAFLAQHPEGEGFDLSELRNLFLEQRGRLTLLQNMSSSDLLH